MGTAGINGVFWGLRKVVLRQEMGGPTDGQLLESFLVDREESAFTALVHRHGRMVMGVCRRVLQNVHDAEDAFQATFLVLARKAATIAPRDAVGAWLYGVAYRTAKKAKAMTAKRQLKERQFRESRRFVTTPEDAWEELQPLLDEELSSLPQKYQSAIILCDLEGKTKKEAAGQLRCPEGTLSSWLVRGRRMLAKRLANRGVTLSAGSLAVVLTRNAASAAVRTGLVISTGKAATLVAAGQAAATGVVSTKVAALAEGVLKAMLLARLKIASAVLVVCAIVAGAALLAHASVAMKPPNANRAEEPRPIAKAAGESTEEQTRADRCGDPLPLGAIARIGTTRLQGSDRVYVAAFSPDGKLFATGLSSSNARLWDAKTGKLLLEMPLAAPSKPNYGGSPVTTLAFAPDGKRLAFGGYWSPSVCLWDLAAGKLMHTFDSWADGWEKKAFVEEGPTLAFTPDGRSLVGGAKDGSVRLWDVETGREQARLTVSDKAVLGMGLSADGRALLTADHYGAVHLWDLDARKHLRSFDTAAQRQHTHRLAPDGQTFAYSTADGMIVVRDTLDGKERRRFQEDAGALRLSYAPDAGALLTARSDGVVTALDTRTGEKRKAAECRLAGPDSAIAPSGPHGAWFAPDGRAMAWALGGTVRLWDLTAGAESPRLEGHRNAVWSVGFSADGRSLVTTSITGEVGCWDATTGAPRRPIRTWLSWDPRTRLSTDRRRAVSVTGDPTTTGKPRVGDAAIYLWEPLADRPPTPLKEQSGPAYHASFTPDGKSVVATHYDGTIGVYDAITGKLGRAIQGKKYLYSPTFAPDGATFAALDSGSVLHLWDFASGREMWHSQLPPVARCLAFSPDGKMIATGHMALPPKGPGISEPGDWLCLWEATGGKQVQRIRTGQHWVNAVEFSPDGRLIATAGMDGTVRLWEVASGNERRRLKGHDFEVHAVNFAPDGRRLASASYDGTALVWEVFDPGPPDAADAKLAAYWEALAGEPVRAHQVIGALMAARSTAAFLAKRLMPVAVPDDRRLARLVADLDAKRYQDREAATKELERLHVLAAPALRKTLTTDPSAETRRRIEGLLAKLSGPLERADLLRDVRAIEALEHIATPDARKLLEALAKGAAEARLTQDAKAALHRLASLLLGQFRF
jgi:RNA polymerase sigma factor (sigma-70 family)